MSSSMTEDIRTYMTSHPRSQSPGGESNDFNILLFKTKNRIMNLARNNESSCATDKESILQDVFTLVKCKGLGCPEKELASLEDTLDVLLRNDVDSVEFYIQLMELLWDGLLSERMTEILKEAFAKRLCKALSESSPQSLNLVDILVRMKPINVRKFVSLIEELASHKVTSSDSKTLLLDKVMPAMFETTITQSIRDGLTQLAFSLLLLVHDEISPKDVEAKIKRVSEQYIQFVGELRDKDYPNWHKLWIFLVRFCGKSIHGSMELANKLLRVVEYAFRNTSYQQRLIGYDCWKEFIDNASLDLDHMCSYKQIKLLVTPLKAKFSKMEVVICKRFDVFVYLLEKLQNRAVLCLREFLEFCFGPLGESVEVNNKSGQGKAVFLLWGKSTNVLMEIVGHSHPDGELCLEEKLIDLTEPVLNSENISSFAEIVTKAYSECFVLLKDWCVSPAQQQTIVKCLWGSLVRMILNSKDESRKLCSQFLTKYLETTVKKFDHDHIRSVFTTIMDSTLSFDDRAFISDLFTPSIVQSVLQRLVTTPYQDSQLLMDKVTDMLNLCLTSKQKLNYISSFIKVLHDTETTENIEHICNIWLMLNDVEDFKKINATVEEVTSYLMWPICHYHSFSEQLKKGVLFNWAKVYMYLCNDSEDNKCLFLLHLEKFFRSNPLRSSTVISFVAIISQFERNYSPDFVSQLFKLCSMVLTLPILPKDDLLKLCSVLLGSMDLSLPFYDHENSDVVIKNITICFDHVLKIHKHVEFLSSLTSCIKSMPNKLRLKFVSPLTAALEKLVSHEDPKIVEDASNLLFIVKNESKEKRSTTSASATFHMPSSRASKIASNLKDQEKSAKLVQQSALQMLQSPSTAIKVKGSQLGKQSPKRARKIMNALPKTPVRLCADDDNTADYVVINTEVSFQPEKLSEHQKEVMHRKREDIPALYQDLSQSQSQDIFKNLNSNSDSIESRAPASNVIPPQPVASEQKNKDIQETVPSPDKIRPLSAVVEHDNVFNIEIIDENDPERSKGEEITVDCIIKDQVKHFIEEHKTNQGYTSDTSVTSNDSVKNLKKKRSKVEAELNKLKVDIVGGEKFLQTLPKRRTRSAIESEKLHLRPRNSDQSKGAKPKGVTRVSNVSQQKTVSPKTISKSKKGEQPSSSVKKDTPKQLTITEVLPEIVTSHNQVKPATPVKDIPVESECSPQETEINLPSQGNTKSNTQNSVGSNPEEVVSSSPKSPRKKIFKSPSKNPCDIDTMNTESNLSNIDMSVYDFRESQDQQEQIQPCYYGQDKQNMDKKQKAGLESHSQKYSEDIIESSQDSFVNLNPTITSPKKRRITRERSFEQSFDGIMSSVSTKHQLCSNKEKSEEGSTAQQELSLLCVAPVEKVLNQQVLPAQDDMIYSNADTDTCETSTLTPSPIVLQLDLPKKPILTESERELCQMDTESLTSSQFSQTMINQIVLGSSATTASVGQSETEMVEMSEKHNVTPPGSETNTVVQRLVAHQMGTPLRGECRESLPTSPVTGDTPTKTTELLNNTMDISPIGSEHNSSDEDKNEPKQVSSDMISGTTSVDVGMPTKTVFKSNGLMSNAFPRSTRLLNMVNVDSPSPVSRRTSQKKRPLRITMSSPATGRIRKLMSGFHSNRFRDSNNATEADKISQPVQEDMLTFSRVVPSPLAVPKSSILKRKFHEDGDIVSPCPKRKRVNFSDPPTTSQKIFIKDKNEHPHPNFSPERLMLTATALFRGIEIDEDDDASIPAVSVIAIPKPNVSINSSNKQDTNVSTASVQSNQDSDEWPSQTDDDVSISAHIKTNISTPVNSADAHPSPADSIQVSEMTSESIGSAATPDTMDITNPFTLKDKPIYPQLMQCQDDLLPILRKVTSPMFVTSLLKDLNNKDVRTIGDLANLSEAEVNRLPFKAPAISNVFKTLDTYYKKFACNDDHQPDDAVQAPCKDSKPSSPVCKVSPVRKSPLKRTPVRAAVRRLYPHNSLNSDIDNQEESEEVDGDLAESTDSNHVETPEVTCQPRSIDVVASVQNKQVGNKQSELEMDVVPESTSDKPQGREKTRTSPRITAQVVNYNGTGKVNSVERMEVDTDIPDAEGEDNSHDEDETEMQVQIITDQPIYPNLISCQDDLLPILKKVTSPMHVTSLLELLSRKNVKTIGDLAKLSKMEINRLPFKDPPIVNVLETLDTYYKKKGISSKKSDVMSPCKKSTKKDRKDISSASTCPKKSPSKKVGNNTVASPESNKRDAMENDDYLTFVKLRDILSWGDRCSKEDATCLVNHLLGKHRSTMLPLVRDFYKSNINEVLQKPDVETIVQYAVKKVGTAEVMKVIGENVPSSQDTSTRSVFAVESASEVASNLQELINTDKISRQELIDKCLLPLVESTDDIASCFNRLPVEDLSRVFIEHGVAAKDVDGVIDHITKKFGNEAIYNAVNKQEILEMCSLEDVLPVVTRNSDGSEIVSFFETCVNNLENEQKSKLLVDMFKHISSKLPVKTLAELHIQFIQSMADRIV